MKQKKWAVAGVTAGLLAGAGAGFVLNIPGGAGASPSRPMIVTAEDASGDSGTITPQHHGNRADHVAEITAKLNEVLQPLVDAGTITAADRTAIITALTTRPTTRPAEGAPRGPQAKLSALVTAGTITQAKADAVAAALQAARPAEGADGAGDHDDHSGSTHQRGPRAEGLAKAAEVIGVSVDELKTALQSGQTIAQVATANGVSVSSVIDAMVADATANLRQRITDLVNGVRPTAPSAPTGN
ncbi:MAG: hypothetical protein B7C54_04290 [Acidimicrobiales bacterium mtb01]|nr:hypothetical protein [Actinomycetota bacterium]TEX46445.1 MAG: hypothetical protein B7C54_04290 [Acidimicrobiales bacterium mtb01]